MNFFQNIFGEQISSKPQLDPIPAEMSAEMTDVRLEPDQFYFDIRLCEMYLRNKAEGGVQYVPRALAITECLYGQGQSLTLPVAVGEHILAEIEAMIGAGDDARPITFNNCPLAGPIPYLGGEIGFFSGLYRVESGNVIDSAISLVADVTGRLGLNLTNYLDIGRQVATRLPSLLGDKNNWRLGQYAPIYKPDDTFFDRYLVVIGDVGEDYDAGALRIHHGNAQESLYIGDDRNYRPFDARDYLLIKLRSAPERNDFQRFDFHRHFEAATQHLLDGNLAQAEWARNELNQAIRMCPDLTEAHRFGLIVLYLARIGKWKETSGLIDMHKGSDHKGGEEDSGDDLRSGAIADIALRENLAEGTFHTLENVRKSWQEFDELVDLGTGDEYSSDSVNRFLSKVSEKRVAGSLVSDLVEAIQIRSLGQGH